MPSVCWHSDLMRTAHEFHLVNGYKSNMIYIYTFTYTYMNMRPSSSVPLAD